MEQEPWKLNKDLAKERIINLAQFISTIRGEVIDRHEPELGDTRLALGVRAYECCRTRIIQLADSGDWPWLSNLTREGRFTFLMGNTPVRFIRYDPQNLPEHKLIVSRGAAKQMRLFEKQYKYSDIRWFFVFDTYYKHPADAAYFVGYDEVGDIVCQWQIPIETSSNILTELNMPLTEPVNVEEAPIFLKQEFKKIVKNQDE